MLWPTKCSTMPKVKFTITGCAFRRIGRKGIHGVRGGAGVLPGYDWNWQASKNASRAVLRKMERKCQGTVYCSSVCFKMICRAGTEMKFMSPLWSLPELPSQHPAAAAML